MIFNGSSPRTAIHVRPVVERDRLPRSARRVQLAVLAILGVFVVLRFLVRPARTVEPVAPSRMADARPHARALRKTGSTINLGSVEPKHAAGITSRMQRGPLHAPDRRYGLT